MCVEFWRGFFCLFWVFVCFVFKLKEKNIVGRHDKSLKIKKVSAERKNISCSIFPLGVDQ